MKTLQRLILATLLCMAALHTQAAPFFLSKDGSTVWDKETGLVWMRCSLGQRFDGTTCLDHQSTFQWVDAALSAVNLMNENGGFAGATDWKIPSVYELERLRSCTSRNDKHQLWHVIYDFPSDCKMNFDSLAFPNHQYLYATTSLIPHKHYKYYFFISFNKTMPFISGVFGGPEHRSDWHSPNTGGFAYKLVRSSPISISEAALTFPVSTDEMRETAKRKAQEEREAAERKAQQEREVAENKARINRAQALKQLNALGARGLYLEAGKAQRNGSVTFVNTNFSAGDLYEIIVEKFPTSEFAVKASDQLNAMGRSENQSRAAREAAEAQRRADSNASSRAACFSRVRRCEANCSTWTVPSVCIRDCQESCN